MRDTPTSTLHSNSDYIAPAEWRWVLLLSTLMMLVMLVPLITVERLRPAEGQFFAGLTHDIPDSAAAVAVMRQSATERVTLPQPVYTPEPLPGMLTELIYIGLGRLAQVLALDAITLFHVTRVLAALLMVHALYLLSAVIWQSVPARRIFSAIATFGGGLGWLLGPAFPHIVMFDTTLSPIYPLHAALMNVHLPLVIGGLSLLSAAVIAALRPGSTEPPSVTNYGLRLLLFSLLVTMIYPPVMLPLTLALVLVGGFHGLSTRLFQRSTLILLWYGVPVMLVTAYLAAFAVQNPLAYGLWLRGLGGAPITLTGLSVSLGIPMLLAVPAVLGVVRRLRPDDSAFMLFWLLWMLALGFILRPLGSAFWVGLMIPVSYFATRGIVEFWQRWLPGPALRLRLGIVGLAVLSISHFSAVFRPLNPQAAQGYYLEADYLDAMRWMNQRAALDVVVMASPQVSQWIPVWSGRRVMYASPNKALNPIEKLGVVQRFYQSDDPAVCEAILNGAYSAGPAYRVRYVVLGPREQAMGGAPCVEGLELRLVYSRGDTRIYVYSGR